MGMGSEGEKVGVESFWIFKLLLSYLYHLPTQVKGGLQSLLSVGNIPLASGVSTDAGCMKFPKSS